MLRNVGLDNLLNRESVARTGWPGVTAAWRGLARKPLEFLPCPSPPAAAQHPGSGLQQHVFMVTRSDKMHGHEVIVLTVCPSRRREIF